MKLRFIGGPLHSLVTDIAIVPAEKLDTAKINGHHPTTPAMPLQYAAMQLAGDSVDVYHESLLKKGKI